MVNSVFALLALGYSPDDPLAAREIGHLADFEIEEGDTLRLRPCLSPVWDTAIVMTALEAAGGRADRPRLVPGPSPALPGPSPAARYLPYQATHDHAGQ